MGCFAQGCITVLIVGFLFFGALLGGAWFVYTKAVSNLTSSAPADVKIEPLTESQFESAENSMARLRTAMAKNEETTVEFTGADLNALVMRDPDFEHWRGRLRIDIADSTMTIAVSAPLHSMPFPRMKKRWFNGTVRFSFTYDSDAFTFDLKSAEAGGHHVPEAFLSSFNSSFDDSMNQSFRDELRKNDRGSEFWGKVKSMSLRGDKLIVTTLVE